MMRSDQPQSERAPRTISLWIEPLEVRAGLSHPFIALDDGPPNYGPTSTPLPRSPSRPTRATAPGKRLVTAHVTTHSVPPLTASGVVAKSPQFYSFYRGPRWAELNAVKASAKLKVNGDFTFTGTNQGRINRSPAVYVWGIDRDGNLPTGPFPGRPNIKFDAVVIVQLDDSLRPTGQVVNLVSGTTTDLPPYEVRIKGRKVTVTVSSKLLPSTGLAPSQYRFNYWPEDGGPPISASVASFAPEFTNAQVGIARRG